MNAAQMVHLTAQIVGASVGVGSLELLWTRRSFARGGLWDWQLLREDFAAASRVAQRGLELLLASPYFEVGLALRALAAFALIFVPNFWLALFLVFGTLAIAGRWRGSYNGGSDAMTLVVLLGLLPGLAGRELAAHGSVTATGAEFAAQAGLAYIAVQVVLSYFIAGFVKVRAADWRSGRALGVFLNLPSFPVPTRLRRLAGRPALLHVLSLAVIAFELGAPLALVWPWPYLTAAMAFHLFNAYALGLNRFVWAWAAAYPAVVYWAEWWARG